MALKVLFMFVLKIFRWVSMLRVHLIRLRIATLVVGVMMMRGATWHPKLWISSRRGLYLVFLSIHLSGTFAAAICELYEWDNVVSNWVCRWWGIVRVACD